MAKESILKLLYDNEIISLKKKGCTFRVKEMCDKYFRVHLSKEQMLQLADEIIELANS